MQHFDDFSNTIHYFFKAIRFEARTLCTQQAMNREMGFMVIFFMFCANVMAGVIRPGNVFIDK